MLYSMTGFGRAEANINNRLVVVEMKSLNGKQFEVSPKLSPILRAYELDIRSKLNTLLMRGNIDLTITIKQEGATRPMTVNTDLAAYYYQGMKQIADKLNIQEDNVLSTLMRMPEVVGVDQDMLPEEDWAEVQKVIQKAADELMAHRKTEGAALYKDMSMRIANIEKLHETILPLETERSEKVRSKLDNALNDMLGKEKVDANRFEQELIYYLERLDFSEEKTRLTQHCKYFRETIEKDGIMKGKVLGFILQEIGREINTLGAKANHAGIQQIVIKMKDELEKAKEQILNIL